MNIIYIMFRFTKQFIVRGSQFFLKTRPPCYAGRAAFLLICIPNDFFTFVSPPRFGALRCWCLPFSSCWSLCPPRLPSVSFCLPSVFLCLRSGLPRKPCVLRCFRGCGEKRHVGESTSTGHSASSSHSSLSLPSLSSLPQIAGGYRGLRQLCHG